MTSLPNRPDWRAQLITGKLDRFCDHELTVVGVTGIDHCIHIISVSAVGFSTMMCRPYGQVQ